VNLNLSDDAETTITLGNPFPLHCGGTATTLAVCSNGFVSTASNGVGHNPSVSERDQLRCPYYRGWQLCCQCVGAA